MTKISRLRSKWRYGSLMSSSFLVS